MLLRRMLLFLSRQRFLEEFFRKNHFGSRAKKRFVAGETRLEALNTTYRLNREGFKVTLDYLGEEVSAAQDAAAAVEEYTALVRDLARENLDAGLSVKLSHLGVRVDPDLAFENLLQVLNTAREYDRFVRVDMEGSDLTEITLDLVHRAHAQYKNIGTVIQSHLRSSGEDLDHLVREGIPVRLVKGAYLENANVAFQNREDTLLSFMRLAETLLKEGQQPAIATHDEKLIEFASDMAFIFGLDESDFEFQMLYGIRRTLQAELLSKGHRVRIYLPYGKDWYGYFMRRLAERPANLWFLLRHLRE
ncbi:MAG: proline dehydrogenase family protein [Syntrophotaleaceae bacterium]